MLRLPLDVATLAKFNWLILVLPRKRSVVRFYLTLCMYG